MGTVYLILNALHSMTTPHYLAPLLMCGGHEHGSPSPHSLHMYSLMFTCLFGQINASSFTTSTTQCCQNYLNLGNQIFCSVLCLSVLSCPFFPFSFMFFLLCSFFIFFYVLSFRFPCFRPSFLSFLVNRQSVATRHLFECTARASLHPRLCTKHRTRCIRCTA